MSLPWMIIREHPLPSHLFLKAPADIMALFWSVLGRRKMSLEKKSKRQTKEELWQMGSKGKGRQGLSTLQWQWVAARMDLNSAYGPSLLMYVKPRNLLARLHSSSPVNAGLSAVQGGEAEWSRWWELPGLVPPWVGDGPVFKPPGTYCWWSPLLLEL